MNQTSLLFCTKKLIRISPLPHSWLLVFMLLTCKPDQPTALLSSASGALPDTLQLFNGKNLDGWTGVKNNWQVEDGMFVGSTMDGLLDEASWIITESEFSDFELTLWVKLLGDENRNSGIYYRGKWQGELDDRSVVGYEFDLGGWGEDDNENWWGELHDPYRRPDLRVGPGRKVIDKTYKPEAWNHVKIRAEGKRIRHWLNGELMVDWQEEDESLQTSGFIGFQMHDATRFKVQFKEIKLVPIND